MARKTTKLGKFESLEAKKLMTADIGLGLPADEIPPSYPDSAHWSAPLLASHDADSENAGHNDLAFDLCDPLVRRGQSADTDDFRVEVEQAGDASAVDNVFAAESDETHNGNDLDIQIRTRGKGGYSDVKRVAIKIGSHTLETEPELEPDGVLSGAANPEAQAMYDWRNPMMRIQVQN